MIPWRLARRVLPERHLLIEGMRERMDEGRDTYSGYLKPKKWQPVDVIASEDSADHALDVANELFLLSSFTKHD